MNLKSGQPKIVHEIQWFWEHGGVERGGGRNTLESFSSSTPPPLPPPQCGVPPTFKHTQLWARITRCVDSRRCSGLVLVPAAGSVQV